MILIVAALAFMAGAWASDALGLPAAAGAGTLAAAAVLGVAGRGRVAWLVGPRLPGTRLSVAALVLVGLGAGSLRMALAQPQFGPTHIRALVGQPLRLEGHVADEPRWTPEGQRLTLAVERVELGGRIAPAEGLVLVELPPEPPRRWDERLALSGTLAAPRSGRGFDYAGYLARHDVFATLAKAKVEAAAPPPASLRGTILGFKERTRRLIVRTLPEPAASLLVGILLGIQSSVPADVWESFNRTGTSHILVISGWNVALVVAALLAFGRRLRFQRWPATLAALAAVALYVMLVGATTSVLRAALMGSIVALAGPLNRRADAWTALAAACLAMTAINPNTLWDLGFQLSALATASLFAWGKPVERGVAWLLRPRWLAWAVEPLTATLAAQVWALPIILYNFGNLSLIAPLANILMVPAVPLAMAAGAALASLGLLWRPLAFLAAPLAWAALMWLIAVARVLAATPWAAVALPPFGIGWIIGWYALSLAGWGWMVRRQRLQTPAEQERGAISAAARGCGQQGSPG